jgi:hypothetical protein
MRGHHSTVLQQSVSLLYTCDQMWSSACQTCRLLNEQQLANILHDKEKALVSRLLCSNSTEPCCAVLQFLRATIAAAASQSHVASMWFCLLHLVCCAFC